MDASDKRGHDADACLDLIGTRGREPRLEPGFDRLVIAVFSGTEFHTQSYVLDGQYRCTIKASAKRASCSALTLLSRNFPPVKLQTKNSEEQSRGIMEFQEEKARNVEDARRSIAPGRMAEDLSSLGRRAKSNIAEAAESAKAEARRIASQQKEAGADRLGDVAGAVHGAARTLEAGMPQVASYVHGAAAQLEDAAETLRHRSVDEL